VIGVLPGKYLEVLSSAASGDIRSISDGKSLHIKTEFGLDEKLPLPKPTSAILIF
ncbi:MAG: hypothetical protein H0X08_08765, partial [Blastocatellia bacterium]|nr:hypothetical protein [Blastocatellia bacterium]